MIARLQGIHLEVLFEALRDVAGLVMRERARRHIDGVLATLGDFLQEDRRRDREFRSGFPQQHRARALGLRIIVHVRILVLHGCVSHVAARGTVVGVSGMAWRCPVDVSAVVLFGHHRPQGHLLVDERQVDHPMLGIVEPAALGASEDALTARLESIQFRRIREQPDRPALGARAVQGALGAAQHLDPLQVIQVRADLALAGRAEIALRGGRDRDVVEIKPDGRGGAPVSERPRMLKFVRPGPTDWIETPGTAAASEEMSGTPRWMSSSPLVAVMLIGVSCRVVTRFVAVTTISPNASVFGTSCWARAAPPASTAPAASRTASARGRRRGDSSWGAHMERTGSLPKCVIGTPPWNSSCGSARVAKSRRFVEEVT